MRKEPLRPCRDELTANRVRPTPDPEIQFKYPPARVPTRRFYSPMRLIDAAMVLHHLSGDDARSRCQLTSPPADVEHFEKSIRPILAEHCYSCHGEKKQNAGLRLDTAAGMNASADGELVIVAGDPAKSRLIRAVTRQGEFPMPQRRH